MLCSDPGARSKLLVSIIFLRARTRSSLVVSSETRLKASVGSGNLRLDNASLSRSYLAQTMMVMRVLYLVAMLFISFFLSLD
jgi:hypothetical protein